MAGAIVGLLILAASALAGPPIREFRDCAECPTMIEIPPGQFDMGAPPTDPDRNAWEEPQHRVTIARPFAAGKFPITRREFAAFIANVGEPADKLCTVWQGTKWGKDPTKDWRSPGFPQDDDHPVVCVSWAEATRYAEWLSRRTNQRYRLPTEAEWEYAARAGTTTRYWWGDEVGVNRANCDGCGSRWDNLSTAPVGSFAANPFGLYDVIGNVWEWTQDCDHNTFIGAPADGSALMTGACERHVVRGGGWFKFPKNNRISFRFWDLAYFRSFILGFRVMRDLN